MKTSLLNPKNTPYLLAGVSVVAGAALFIFATVTEGPVTRDPNIGTGLLQLLASLLIIVGVVGGGITLLVRKVRASRKK